MKRVEEKMLDYWRAEVPVIGHIYPDLQVIHVYNGKNMVVCMAMMYVLLHPFCPIL